MTSTVKGTAHCAATRELVVSRSDGQVSVYQDGQHYETYVYDGLSVTVTERDKVPSSGGVTTDSEVGGDGPHK